jgi:iron complex outermembrane receptor protein
MFARSVRSLKLATILLAIAVPGLAAQQGILAGAVTNAETGAPISAAQIQVFGGAQDTGTLSGNDGRYRIGLAPGSYDLVVTVVGYRTTRFDDLEIVGGQTTTFDMQLLSQAQELDAIVITASRGTPEKSTEAPASSFNVSSQEISERPSQTLADHLKTTPGVDVITQGVQATNVVVRGFNNIFSGALHMLTDHRLAGVPSLRVNLMHFIPTSDEDVDRMEVVLGPGSALYGPNTANGVVHILTKSPLDDQGTTITMGAGERDLFQGSFRTAFLLNEDFGIKLSGQYLQATEWPYTDPVEEQARLAAVNPEACLTDKTIRGFGSAVAETACGRVGQRDFDIERYGLEARADWRFAEDGTLVGTYGRTNATGIELTGLGAGQNEDWVYDFFQARVSKGRLFTQGYYNRSNAGDTWLLRDGVPLVDKSSLFVAQAQHGFALADGRQDFTYGIDYFATRPDTEGSINGSYEDEDDIDEWGVYLQSKTELSEMLELVVAGRVDSHSLIDAKVFSPRAALLFTPAEEQSFRLSYNRAFSTPSTLNFFLDISGGAAPESLGTLGYTTRAFGTGKDGYSFQTPDGTLRGMRSPFTPAQLGGAGQLLPADVGVMWDLLVGVLQAQGAISPAQAAQISGWDPTNDDISRMLLDLNNPSELTPLSATRIPDVPGITESNTETIELGWTGILQDRVKITADVYYMQKNDFVSPLQVQTPLLLLNGEDTGAFIVAQAIADGMDPAQAQAMAQTLAPVLAQIPAGVVSSDQVAAQAADLIATYRNVGDLDLWGGDLAVQAFVNDEWTVNGSYSWVSDDYFRIEGAAPVSLNAPTHKGSLGLAYRNVRTGLTAGGRARFSSGFPAESAGYVGTECLPGVVPSEFTEPCVDAFAIFDVNFGYAFPGTGATVQLAINNVLDTGYRSFVGVPTIGRFALLRLRYDLF